MTRSKLIEATTQVVREVGYARATTRAIAEAAGVAEGTIYRHFPQKQQLFFAAILERNAPIIEWVSALPDRAGNNTVRENLGETLRRLAQLRDDVLPLELSLRADPDLAREHLQALASLPEGPPPGPPAHIAAYLAAEQALGRVRDDLDPMSTAIVLLATLFGLGMLPPSPSGEMDATLLEATLDLLVDGIRPDAARSSPEGVNG